MIRNRVLRLSEQMHRGGHQSSIDNLQLRAQGRGKHVMLFKKLTCSMNDLRNVEM